MARRFADEYGMVRLSAGEALRLVLETQPRTQLAVAIDQHLRRGVVIPDALTVQAIEVAIMDMRCQTRGSVY